MPAAPAFLIQMVPIRERIRGRLMLSCSKYSEYFLNAVKATWLCCLPCSHSKPAGGIWFLKSLYFTVIREQSLSLVQETDSNPNFQWSQLAQPLKGRRCSWWCVGAGWSQRGGERGCMRAEVVFLDLPARVLHIKEENRKTRIVSHKSVGAALLDWNDKLSDLMHQSQTRYLLYKNMHKLAYDSCLSYAVVRKLVFHHNFLILSAWNYLLLYSLSRWWAAAQSPVVCLSCCCQVVSFWQCFQFV